MSLFKRFLLAGHCEDPEPIEGDEAIHLDRRGATLLAMTIVFFLMSCIFPHHAFAKLRPVSTQKTVPDTTPYFEKNYDVKSDNFKPLSKKKGILFALSPINGDGLIYTGHYVTAGFMLGLEFLGVVGMIGGAHDYLAGPAKTDLNSNENFFLDPYDMSKFIFFTGLTLFGISYAVDAISTPLFVSAHNKNLNKAEVHPRVLPHFTATDRQWGAGVTVTF